MFFSCAFTDLKGFRKSWDSGKEDETRTPADRQPNDKLSANLVLVQVPYKSFNKKKGREVNVNCGLVFLPDHEADNASYDSASNQYDWQDASKIEGSPNVIFQGDKAAVRTGSPRCIWLDSIEGQRCDPQRNWDSNGNRHQCNDKGDD